MEIHRVSSAETVPLYENEASEIGQAIIRRTKGRRRKKNTESR
jgi:hypothetical protein